MTWLAGIDGCRGGWIVAFRKAGTRGFDLRVIDTIADMKTQKIRPGIVCIDVPIGLLEHAARGGRECDRKARARLGQPKASSVFSPPVRPALSARSYEEALRRNRASSKEGIGISRQAYGIFGKIAEVDAFMTGSTSTDDGGSASGGDVLRFEQREAVQRIQEIEGWSEAADSGSHTTLWAKRGGARRGAPKLASGARRHRRCDRAGASA